MVHRREVLSRFALSGAVSTLVNPAGEAEAAAQTDLSDALRRDIGNAILAIRDELARQASFWEIAAVRDPLRTFLRTNAKFPDFIEVGTDVWQNVYDWHVRFQQPLALGRTADGRYSIKLLETSVILRSDATAGFVGIPYDAH